MKYVLLVVMLLVCSTCEANAQRRLAKAQHKVTKLQAKVNQSTAYRVVLSVGYR